MMPVSATFAELYKTKLCVRFARGACTDDACPFAHGEAELRSRRRQGRPEDCFVLHRNDSDWQSGDSPESTGDGSYGQSLTKTQRRRLRKRRHQQFLTLRTQCRYSNVQAESPEPTREDPPPPYTPRAVPSPPVIGTNCEDQEPWRTEGEEYRAWVRNMLATAHKTVELRTHQVFNQHYRVGSP